MQQYRNSRLDLKSAQSITKAISSEKMPKTIT